MRAWPLLLVAACGDPVGTGAATSTAHPTARSATLTVDNVTLGEPAGTFRLWTVAIVEDAPGTPCTQVGEPLVVLEIYDVYTSAPRGEITVSLPPPRIFPALNASVADGGGVQGMLTITAAASTGLAGELDAFASIGGMLRTMDITFEAPTCAL